MIGFTIEYIWFIFPLLCLFLNHIKCRNIVKVLVLFCIFTVIYTLSLNGSDFHGYKKGYEWFVRGDPWRHGEKGYYLVIWICAKLGMDYTGFRLVFLGTASIVLFYSIYKISPRPAFSLFLVSSMFIVYTISGYRQYMVMAFVLFSCWIYCKGKRYGAIFILALMMYIHTSAVVPLVILLMYHFFEYKIKRIKNINRDGTNIGAIILLLCILMRIVIYTLLKNESMEIFLQSLGLHKIFSISPTLVSAGLLSRLFFVVVVMILYEQKKPEHRLLNLLYWMYVVSMAIYIVIPLEYLMGRLMNNANIIVTVLLPMLMCYNEEVVKVNDLMFFNSKYMVHRILSKTIVLVAMSMLVFQLLKQDGYTPYYNIIKGDTADMVVFEEY